jgi:broad specificity phosphatase PhoE
VTLLFLIRHGRSTWNAEHRIQGNADPPLDEVGQEQARQLADRLQRSNRAVMAVYTSPLRRARQTAQILGDALGVPVTSEERLTEYDVGDITGLTWEQVVKQYPDVAQRWAEASEDLDIPGAEESASFRERVAIAFGEIVERHAGESVGVVAHGGTLGSYLNHLIRLPSRFSPFRFGNASLTIVEVNSVRSRILLLNDTCHLGGPI